MAHKKGGESTTLDYVLLGFVILLILGTLGVLIAIIVKLTQKTPVSTPPASVSKPTKKSVDNDDHHHRKK